MDGAAEVLVPVRPRHELRHSPAVLADGQGADRLMLGALSGACALLHVAAAIGHRGESELYFALFLGLGAFQLAWALLVAGRPWSPSILLAGIVVSTGVIMVWICSRTIGLPLGPAPGRAELVGIPDLVATLDEAIIVAAASSMLIRREPLRERSAVAICTLFVASLLVFLVLGHVG